MKEKDKLQKGTLRRSPRAHGKWSWEWRYVNPSTGKQDSKYLSGDEFPTEPDVRAHLEPFIQRLNDGPTEDLVIVDPNIGDLLDRFIKQEKLLHIVKRKPGERTARNDELAYSTAKSYMSLCNKIREAWGTTKLDRFKPLQFENWLKAINVKPKTKGHLKAFVNRLFNRAKVYEMLDFHENPIQLVEVRGISKRTKKQVDLRIEQCFVLVGLLPEPYRTMVLCALCTGLRVAEILALDWSKIDLECLSMRVDEDAVHGRLGPVKTDYSNDALPLAPEFAEVLFHWKRATRAGESGLVFPSHLTGRCYHASPLQQDWIRRAGWCLVECPECGAAAGERCAGLPLRRHDRPLIQVHKARQAAAQASGLDSIGWHTFRHKYTTLLRQFGTPLDVQQELLRHADIRTTMGYGEVPMDNERSANSQVVRAILLRKPAD